ncbi:TadE/TadG family type IV pilus assembly protein [Kitasatospora sp. NPDC002551]|uniref:TadE/TadG family type IV pilus assembly protein n=1 Tax=Kitasatospora sp. NPDC002551 TaxID=3154539 RepID=UPI00331729E8
MTRTRTALLRRRTGDRGSISLEAAILFPVLFGILALVVVAGRVGSASGTVSAAARAAARAASLERDGATARTAGTTVARQTLADQGVRCDGLKVDIPTGGFTAALGVPASVTVTVSCTVPLSDLVLPGLPGSRTVKASFTSPIDPYRGRPAS